MRTLIIEDDRQIRESLVKAFREECFATDSANDGEKGLYLARTNQYDVIVLDNVLPKMRGIEVCRQLRGSGIKTPILILSVRAETISKIDLLNAGADDYLVKPFSFEELFARIRALLRRPLTLQGDVLKHGDLVVNVAKHTVSRGKKPVTLTRKEFALLEYFLRNRGTVLTRAMIMEHVWDSTSDPFSNTIESHITSLRKKIEDPRGLRLITTVSGRGYKIAE